MATTTLTVNPQVITVSGTSEHEIDWKDMLSIRYKGGAGSETFSITITS